MERRTNPLRKSNAVCTTDTSTKYSLQFKKLELFSFLVISNHFPNHTHLLFFPKGMNAASETST